MDGRIVPASPEFIARVWNEYWGGDLQIAGDREYRVEDVQGLAWRESGERDVGLVTWAIDGQRAEIVSLAALAPGRGIGSRLMDAAEEELRRRGVARVILTTTNDNYRAFAFYLRRGYRLVRLHLDSMDRVRRVKPAVPAEGVDGIPLLDMWELEKRL